MTNESQRLLTEYANTGSESAFRELVTRYVDLVFSTALRLVDGDAHRAEDVTQVVFTDLARNAPELSRIALLGGWLHRDTCFVAAKLMRGERRRQTREKQAVEMNALNQPDPDFEPIAPVLDEVINELADEDRQAILLRFYERMDLRSVGEALGSSENAAQKRVSRALDLLHSKLARRGIVFSAAGLASALAAQAIQAAPAGFAASVATKVLAGTAVAAAASGTAAKTALMFKLKIGGAILASLLLLGWASTYLVTGFSQNKPEFKVRLGGTPGLKFTGTLVFDGVSTNLSGVVPAVYQVNGRSVKCSFKKAETEGRLSLEVSEHGRVLGSSATSSPFAGVLAEIRDYGFAYQKTMFTTF